MRILRGIFDKLRPLFGDGGKLHTAEPLFNAMDNFAFWSNSRTPGAPHVRDPLDVKRFMSMVIVGLAPCLAAAFYFFGWRVLSMIVVSYAAGGAVEVAFAIIRKEDINEGFLVTGLLFPLILPPTLPLWMVGVGVAFGVLVGKEIFGGTGRNLFNPALVGRCFLFIAYPLQMTTGWVKPILAWPGRLTQYVTVTDVDAIAGATPLSKTAADYELWDLLIGNVPGTIGGVCSLAVIIGGLILLATRVANWRPTIGMIGSFVLFAWLGQSLDTGTPRPILYHLFSGGMLFGAFFMATDPVSAPSTNPARLAYGILIGLLTVLIRYLTPLPEGVMYAILLGNISAPILDEVVIRSRLRRLANEG